MNRRSVQSLNRPHREAPLVICTKNVCNGLRGYEQQCGLCHTTPLSTRSHGQCQDLYKAARHSSQARIEEVGIHIPAGFSPT